MRLFSKWSYEAKTRVIVFTLVSTAFLVYFVEPDSIIFSPVFYIILIFLTAISFPRKWSWACLPVFIFLSFYIHLKERSGNLAIYGSVLYPIVFGLVYTAGLQFRTMLVELISSSRFVKSQSEEVEQVHTKMLSALVNAIEAKDDFLYNHSKNVAEIARKIACFMGLSSSEVNEVYYSALLHDIGKIGVRESTLNKKSPLTESEWYEIKRHPIIGASILAHVPQFQQLAENVLYHHKYFDGNGYPEIKVEGKNIPLGARIIAVADAFDAMTSNRVYRKKMTVVEACKELKRCGGTQFDPEIVEALIAVVGNDLPRGLIFQQSKYGKWFV
ncbi:HD-GYP domain-containing protein [Thermosediminibacter oceani]|uniref:Metal dependent phosphohydrolase n=1 Tax=Thermosediminibacter oceani (strain ATCC BAA-1034 / DSM 16646 / JW/IW-1228P) TaxID=555079 RepID=D9RY65_THEOJ|nr:HD-GYP domain-containing protein [Thermosediminibacter oceani]ADL08289.1 metal dependent phosphohydrolase [Thermosediminibacter oceani DSM 16646]